jgi:hypothetical protein
MAKQKSFLLVGLPHTGVPLLTAALEQHRVALAELGVTSPAKSADEAFRAAVELRREHRAWGLRRKDVEGTWSAICRRAVKQRQTVVVGHELLAGATRDEVALLVDGLAGTQVHVVVLAGVPDGRLGLFPDELDLGSVLDRWAAATSGPDRLHVVVTDPADAKVAWRALGSLVGFDAEGLALPDPAGLVVPVDTASLRLIAEYAGVHVDHDELVDVAEGWAKAVADRGHDVVGDLRDLVPRRWAHSTDPARAAYDQRVDVLTEVLVEAVTEVGRLRERLRELEQTDRRKRSVRLPGVLVRSA